MPSALVKKVAEEKKLSVDVVEEKWDNAKDIAEKKFGETESDDFYAYTTRVFQNMVGLL